MEIEIKVTIKDGDWKFERLFDSVERFYCPLNSQMRLLGWSDKAWREGKIIKDRDGVLK